VAQCLVLTEPHGTGEGADYRYRRDWKFGEMMLLHVLDTGIDTGEFRG
jgi:hypothetical protein